VDLKVAANNLRIIPKQDMIVNYAASVNRHINHPFPEMENLLKYLQSYPRRQVFQYHSYGHTLSSYGRFSTTQARHNGYSV